MLIIVCVCVCVMGSTHVGVSVNTQFCVCASSVLIPQESPTSFHEMEFLNGLKLMH